MNKWLTTVQQQTVDNVIEIKETIRQYQWREQTLTQNERWELDMAHATLKDIQEKCYHSWEIMKMFTSVQKRCEYCDLQDKTYDYHKDSSMSTKIKLDY